jgi:hypothetical protein
VDISLPAGGAETVQARPIGFWHALQRVGERRALRAARRTADAELMSRRHVPLRLAWRAEELVSTKNRLDLAHALRSLVRDASPSHLPTASPVNRGAVRVQSEAFLGIALRLADLEHPIAARGVVMTDRLLTDGSGPLYDRDRADELPAYLRSTRAALEPR